MCGVALAMQTTNLTKTKDSSSLLRLQKSAFTSIINYRKQDTSCSTLMHKLFSRLESNSIKLIFDFFPIGISIVFFIGSFTWYRINYRWGVKVSISIPYVEFSVGKNLVFCLRNRRQKTSGEDVIKTSFNMEE